MNATVFTQEDLKRYQEDGFLLVKGMLSGKEVELLGRTAREDRVLDQHSFGRADGEGGTVRLSVWNHPTDTIYGNDRPVGVFGLPRGAAPRRRGLSLSLQDDYEGCQGGRRMDLAPGLRILVSVWISLPVLHQRLHRG